MLASFGEISPSLCAIWYSRSMHITTVASNTVWKDAEDVATHDGVYAYADIAKADITAIGRALPLAESFKATYAVASNNNVLAK